MVDLTKRMLLGAPLAAALGSAASTNAQAGAETTCKSEAPVQYDLPVARGPFSPTVESLRTYQTPDWFRDAKFGIWSHWGPQAVPRKGDWYARYMYVPGHPHYEHHVKTYGQPSKVGYKDIIPLWKAEKFDPEGLMDRYAAAGAKYFVSMGMHTAKAFANAGAAVVLADVNGDGARLAADALIQSGHRAIGLSCNVAEVSDVEAMVRETIATFGRLDVAFNNAGIQNVLAETADATPEDFDRVNSVNLRGMWACMKYELQHMREQGSGAIVNCSSIGGLVGGFQRGTYHAAKHGVLGLTKSAALEYADRNIRVNAVCPGLIWTPMAEQMAASGQTEALEAIVAGTPMRRHGRTEEIADVVLWLASTAASYVTGQSISVDGGLLMR